jgi:hypothetical protein
MLPRMNLLLEAAAGHGDQTGAIITGLVVFAGLLGLLAALVGFGSARPHTVSERE